MERFSGRYEPDPNSGCWLWSGAMPQKAGYGTIQVMGVSRGAHRVAWELYRGPIPDGLFVLHKCDVRACVNPDHLWLGDHEANMADMVRKGRTGNKLGEESHASKLKAADIPVIMKRLENGEGCREIGASYGLTDCTVNAIRRGISWRSVTGLPKPNGVTFSHNEGG